MQPAAAFEPGGVQLVRAQVRGDTAIGQHGATAIRRGHRDHRFGPPLPPQSRAWFRAWRCGRAVQDDPAAAQLLADQVAADQGHGSRAPRSIVRGTIIRVQVEHVPAKTRPPKVLWLWWVGPEGLQLDLDLAWRAYIRRFDLEHTVRFAKQTLGWTTPRPRHPAQADRWTWLVLAAYTQLRLARPVVADARLPWERPRPRGGCHRCGCAAGFRDFWPRLAPGGHAETRRALPRPAQGQPLRARHAISGHQEARQEGQQEGNHGHEGRLTGSDQARPAADPVSGQPSMPKGLNHKLRPEVPTGLPSAAKFLFIIVQSSAARRPRGQRRRGSAHLARLTPEQAVPSYPRRK
jgi:hypothetical protein